MVHPPFVVQVAEQILGSKKNNFSLSLTIPFGDYLWPIFALLSLSLSNNGYARKDDDNSDDDDVWTDGQEMVGPMLQNFISPQPMVQ